MQRRCTAHAISRLGRIESIVVVFHGVHTWRGQECSTHRRTPHAPRPPTFPTTPTQVTQPSSSSMEVAHETCRQRTAMREPLLRLVAATLQQKKPQSPEGTEPKHEEYKVQQVAGIWTNQQHSGNASVASDRLIVCLTSFLAARA